MKSIAGILDISRSGGSLGTLLILLEELEIQRQIHSADSVEVVLIGDARYLLDAALSERTGASSRLGLPDNASLSPILAVLKTISGVTNYRLCSDRTATRDAMDFIGANCVMWPDPERLVQGAHNYDSTGPIQAFFAQAGSIPRLSVTAEWLAWAKCYLRERSGGRLPVAVHLKYNPNAPGQSNAKLESWMAFFSRKRSCEAHFFLVGDDATNKIFRDVPNVTIAQNDGIRLDGYLALIQAASLFMGMMSGPANMALFGRNPYLIFKNPDHHAREMAIELGGADRYSFALANQRVLRIWDTTNNLTDAFERATQLMAA